MTIISQHVILLSASLLPQRKRPITTVTAGESSGCYKSHFGIAGGKKKPHLGLDACFCSNHNHLGWYLTQDAGTVPLQNSFGGN